MGRILISEEEKQRILGMHVVNGYSSFVNEQATAGTTTPSPGGLKQDNPDSVTIEEVESDGKSNFITFNKNGTFKSTLPLVRDNPKSNSGIWKFNSTRSGSQFGGGFIEYYVGGYNVFSQEINSDIFASDALSTLISTDKKAYTQLPVMTKLANLAKSNYSMPGQEGQGAQVASKTPGCPAGCIKDPNYKGVPQKWVASK
jgi:hypothetical protein